MPRLIDADAMRQDWLENGENEFVYDTNAVLSSIDEQPTIDAEPVVRCKDCENAKPTTVLGKYQVYKCCGDAGAIGYTKVVAPDDYCSCGERRKICDGKTV